MVVDFSLGGFFISFSQFVNQSEKRLWLCIDEPILGKERRDINLLGS